MSETEREELTSEQQLTVAVINRLARLKTGSKQVRNVRYKQRMAYRKYLTETLGVKIVLEGEDGYIISALRPTVKTCDCCQLPYDATGDVCPTCRKTCRS